MQGKNNIHSKILRLFNGEANPYEKEEIRAWINESDSNRKLYSDLQEIWISAGISDNSDSYNVEHAIKIFKERTGYYLNSHKKFRISELYKYAAIIILLISLPIIYFLNRDTLHVEESFTTINCAFGDKSTIMLPDSSQVYLNSGSKIIFNNNFHDEYRMVCLEGEAYFCVEKNEEIPFIVKTSGIEIKVLGTEFNLKAYPDEEIISTTLKEGRIEIKSNFQKSIMKPNQKVVYNRADKKMKLYILNDLKPETEWKDGRLVFRDESLEELELKLERWFDVDIVFADQQVKKRRFTGILERESILEVLTYLNYSEEVGYKINDNEITFYSK